jgi:hypothetical protein
MNLAIWLGWNHCWRDCKKAIPYPGILWEIRDRNGLGTGKCPKIGALPTFLLDDSRSFCTLFLHEEKNYIIISVY